MGNSVLLILVHHSFSPTEAFFSSSMEKDFAATGNLSGVVLAIVLCHAGILPMPFAYPVVRSANWSALCSLGPWAMLFGPCGLILGLMLSPYLPRWTSDLCFIDAACVDQDNALLKERGIRGIGGFLLVSKELRILWSKAYLSRLWCAPRPRMSVCYGKLAWGVPTLDICTQILGARFRQPNFMDTIGVM